jgi:hypothetical protein
MILPTTSPSARTSKSSSRHSPEVLLADACLRISGCLKRFGIGGVVMQRAA